jgi:hypothetical protein
MKVSIGKIKSAILGGKQLPAKATRSRMKPTEARAMLSKLATGLRGMVSERAAAEAAASKLADTSKLDFQNLWSNGQDLPNLTQIRMDAENATLRSQAATSATNHIVEAAIQALIDLANTDTDQLDHARTQIQNDIATRLKSVGLDAEAANLLEAHPAGRELIALERSKRSVNIPTCRTPGANGELRLTLLEWRATPLASGQAETRDQFAPLEIADEIDAFLNYHAAVGQLAASLAG